ncbi:hypothetical protein [Nostoc sp.]|uniref:hypothetical protein n=1 Tax=Nostoc sp. TaxID=1180 RepID=UPI002FF6274F
MASFAIVLLSRVISLLECIVNLTYSLITLPKVSYRRCDTKSSEIASTTNLLKAIA